MLTELGVLDDVMEHVMDGVCDGVCDGVWLFGKDSFEECPLTDLASTYVLCRPSPTCP